MRVLHLDTRHEGQTAPSGCASAGREQGASKACLTAAKRKLGNECVEHRVDGKIDEAGLYERAPRASVVRKAGYREGLHEAAAKPTSTANSFPSLPPSNSPIRGLDASVPLRRSAALRGGSVAAVLQGRALGQWVGKLRKRPGAELKIHVRGGRDDRPQLGHLHNLTLECLAWMLRRC
jgi:hypothetical protein